MKLSEHVDRLRNLIEAAFDKHFARLGIGKNKQLDIEKLPVEVRSKRLRFEEMLENHIGETGDYEHAREKLIDELTFTLFNRLAAVKVMEAAALFPPVLTKQPEHGDRSFGHKAWLEMNPHMRSEELEGIREYLKTAFDELGETLPLYSKTYPYALLPDGISLNEIIDAFNAVEKDSQAGSDIWQSDDVLGWMYESYNNVKKKAHKDSGDKTEYNKVSLQSQVYTPRWVVQFLVENSLGKLYLEMYPDSEIKRRYKIANPPQKQERKPKPLHEVKTIDPACGSGNFLLYAFDFFYELYVDQIDNYGADYDEKDIPKLIIENNLHGIDLDDRAVQLAQLGLFIKAKKKRRTIGELAFNVVSSDFYLPEYETVKDIFEPQMNTDERGLEDEQKMLIREIWDDLKFAYKFGSLIRIDERVNAKLKDIEKRAKGDLFGQAELETHKSFAATFFSNLKTAVEQYAQAQGNTFLTSKTRDAITFLELLTTEYDVAMANPPYTDSADFGPELKQFIEDNYKKPYKFHTNLYATFIKRCYEITGSDGKVAMIHPHTFMFIKTFEDVRKFMIDKCHIDAMVDFGLDRVNLFGPGILLDATFYVLSKGQNDKDGLYFNLTTNLQERFKKGKFFEALNDYVGGISNDRVYTLEQSKLKIIKSWPFIYWISDEFREKFKEKSVKDLLKNCQGLATANNNQFLRFWWELSPSDETIDNEYWVYYAKGGPYKKWSGNLWLMVNWKSDGYDIKNYVDDKGKQKSRPQNEAVYFKEGITYSASGSKGPSYRLLPKGCIFDVGGSSIFPINKYKNNSYILAFFNSPFSKYVIECLNPTVNKQVGDVERVPFVIPDRSHEYVIESLAQRNIEITTSMRATELFDGEFKASPLLSLKNGDWKSAIYKTLNRDNRLLTQVLINEAIINEKIFEVYDLTEQDKAMVLAKEGKSIGGLPVSPEARDAYLADTEAINEFPLDTIRDFIKALPTKEFTAEECEAIESGFGSLYQSNNDLEEFCIRHQVNPINVWFWFKQSNVTPQQRMHTLAMEFLADMTREILMEDEDGIIPLVTNAGEKVLLDRIEEKFREKGFSTAQYSSFDTILGHPIHEYLNKYFFAELSDHLNLFMYLPKTPFIWHLSSGSEQGFDCYIIIYKWSRDKLMRLRSVYIEHRERSLVNRQSDLSGNESADAQNEKDLIFRQLKEIEAFKAKIDELLTEGYNPILDDGVGKNIAPLQKKGLIPYEVLNAGQLKKYLNADW
ncbi:N-6 DNA methylase [Nitrosomonas oligotropha]|uniref:site-specific DNA-methyltransferase (adenine-specific) n=1 Tax=Nitrosomonas oligotropha TaxID=42354 RepID=A0A2T5I0P7_9PROT|nr:BREX-1 system adenine-specific DNA-methyltransferase PglX [Nitrosomonas oligotropha]PTQ77405.1 N-6 DNA methylase [Nitrosomonas oligotropha]